MNSKKTINLKRFFLFFFAVLLVGKNILSNIIRMPVEHTTALQASLVWKSFVTPHPVNKLDLLFLILIGGLLFGIGSLILFDMKVIAWYRRKQRQVLEDQKRAEAKRER